MTRQTFAVALTVLLAAMWLAAQQPSAYQWDLPRGVPPPRVPVGSPMTAERVELGRHLFYDKRLSGNGTPRAGARLDRTAPSPQLDVAHRSI